MKNGATCNLVFGGCLVIVHLFTTEDEPLLGRRNALLFLHAFFYPLHLVCWFDVDFNLLARERLHLDQHGACGYNKRVSGPDTIEKVSDNLDLASCTVRVCVCVLVRGSHAHWDGGAAARLEICPLRGCQLRGMGMGKGGVILHWKLYTVLVASTTPSCVSCLYLRLLQSKNDPMCEKSDDGPRRSTYSIISRIMQANEHICAI